MKTSINIKKIFRVLAENSGFPVCLGPFKSEVKLNTLRTVKCILCQETEALTFNGKPRVCCGFLQK